ncbi:response regulator, partial [Candidatus Poribacteria bacterium]|nr:response regulator [Candidatus Poribacteria bacterium]
MDETILVVDDEESIRDIFTIILEKEKYNVVTVQDGFEAIREIEHGMFNLAIVDINIPGPGGIEILKSIKNKNEDTEVIIISGHASLDTAIEAIRQGAYDYIVKPFDVEEIPDTLRRALAKQKRVSETRQLLDQLRQRTHELSVLSELYSSASYTLDYRELVGPVMESLSKIIDHDISSLLFVDKEGYGELNIWLNKEVGIEIINKIKANMIDEYNKICPNGVCENALSIKLNRNGFYKPSYQNAPLDVKSSLNIPLSINDNSKEHLAGILNINSFKDDAFDKNNSDLFCNIANNISNGIERLNKVLSVEKSKLEMMMGSMSDGVMLFDMHGPITVLNPASEKMLGLIENTSFRHIAESIGNTRLARVIDKFWNFRQTNGFLIGDFGFKEEFIVEKTGKFINANVSPIKDHNGKTNGIMAVLRDITRQKEIDEAKSSFVSGVSHELRTPLTAIKNAVSIIEMAGETNEQQQKFLSISMRNIDRLERLINRILDFSRLESNRLKMEFGFVNLKSIAGECFSAIQNLAANKSIEIIDVIPDNIPDIYADYQRLEQVFTNLLDNAIKYTPDGGKITMNAKVLDYLYINRKSIPIPQFIPSPGFVEVCISDTGIGISPEDQSRIFDRFEQVGKMKASGVGLGLSIVKKIIENHNGDIRVESESGKGSKFIFILPATRKCNNLINLIMNIEKEISMAKADRSSFSVIMNHIIGLDKLSSENGENIKIIKNIDNYIQNKLHLEQDSIFIFEECNYIFCLYR